MARPAEHPLIPALASSNKAIADQLVDLVEGRLWLRVGLDGSILIERNGVWRPNGEDVVRALVANELKAHDVVARALVSEVVASVTDRLSVDRVSYDLPDVWKVPFVNGLLDIATMELEPYNPEARPWLVQLPWDWIADVGQEPGAIHGFLTQVLHADAVAFNYEVDGYMCLPRNPLRKALLNVGKGSNGKSVHNIYRRALIGGDNCASVPLKRLAGDDRFAASSLVGKLANICGDIDSRELRDTSVFKQITGGEPIYVERKGKDGFDFTCGAFPVFSANITPTAEGANRAFVNRWLVQEYSRQFADDAREEARLHGYATDRTEMERYASRCMWALHALYKRGNFDVPASAQAAHARFARKLDSVATFIHERCELVPEARIPRTTLNQEYQTFCTQEALRPEGRNDFYERVMEMGVGVHRDREFVGVRLRVEAEDFVGAGLEY